jgi:peroxiredoxin
MARAGFAHLTLAFALAGAAVPAAQFASGDALAGISFEGRSAPAVESGVAIGARLPRSGSAPRQPQLLFFWAHWCQECKGESPIIARITDKYQARGLTVVAPTKRYGYVESGRIAAPDRELRYILKVRDEYYPFLRRVAVPVSDANYTAFGITAVPTLVLIDRQGIVRLYRQGRMTEEELDTAIASILTP